MPERRMFAKTIVLSDVFLDMPTSARCLYFTLGMFADDDGFINNPKAIMRQCGASNDDMNILCAKKFILTFEDGVVVIKHWRIHNYIQKDRYIPTKYERHKSQLSLDENNAYSFNNGELIANNKKETKPLTPARQKRLDAIKESELPYSFSYKIRNAFVGEICPICHCRMGVVTVVDDNVRIKNPAPTIQHNIPISKGGKHELHNISVICEKCNLSIQDKETPALNNELVIEKWDEICRVSGMYTQDSIGKDSIGKVRIGKDKEEKENKNKNENNNIIYNIEKQDIKKQGIENLPLEKNPHNIYENMSLTDNASNTQQNKQPPLNAPQREIKSVEDLISRQNKMLQEPLKGYSKMCEEIGKPLDIKHLQEDIEELRFLAHHSVPLAVEIIQQSIEYKMRAFYPLDDDNAWLLKEI